MKYKRMGSYFSRTATNSVTIKLSEVKKQGLYFKCSNAADVLAAFQSLKE